MLTLVTGASGHIGNTLVKALLKRGRQVRAFVRPTSNLAGLQGPEGKTLPGLEIVQGNLLDRESIERALPDVDVVYHTAAIFKTRNVDEGEMIRTNLEGTKNVLSACTGFKRDLKKIIYTSSVAAVGYRREPRSVLAEGDWNTDPIDAYVASKIESELLAREMARRLELPVVIVNPATVLGPNDYSPTPSNDFILLLMKKIPPVWFESGHSYVDVEDVAEGHILAEEKGKLGERYILSGENVSNRVLFEMVAKITGGRKPWIKLGHMDVELLGWGVELLAMFRRKTPLFTRAKAHKLIRYFAYYDNRRSREDLGFSPRPLNEILPRCQAWFRQQNWLK